MKTTCIANRKQIVKCATSNLFQLNLKDLPSKHSSRWRCLEDVFRFRLQKTSSRCLQDVLIKTDTFALVTCLQKTSSKGVLQKTSLRHLQDVLKTYHQVKLLLLNGLQDVFEMYSTRSWGVLRRRLSTERFA